jgi:hypothetical protein
MSGRAAAGAIIPAMTDSTSRQPVRLGAHRGRSVYDEFKGLHESAAGLTAITGGAPDDPLVMFEEHGMGEVCRYFELLPKGELRPGLNPQLRNEPLRKMVASQDMRTRWFAIRNIFTQEDPAYVNQVIAGLRATTGSGGLAPLVEVSRRFQRRTNAMRLLAVAQSQPDLPLTEILDQNRSLQHHAASLFPTWTYQPLVLLASPFARGFVGGRGIEESLQTVLLVFLGGTREGVVLHDDEITWDRVYETDLPTLRELPRDGTTWMRHTNHDVLDLDAAVLLSWWTESLNHLYTEATDLGRYRRQDGLLDAGRGDRTFRTLERIIANCIRIQARPTDHLMRVALAFEFLDLMPNLVDQGLAPSHVWERLVNPGYAKSILHGAFAAAPEPIRKRLRKRSTQVLAKLTTETLDHLVFGQSEGKQISVAGKRQSHGAFIAELLHQLRNTHHGYELDDVGKRAILSAHTGHVSEAFPELVVLYTIALITDGRRALAGEWF